MKRKLIAAVFIVAAVVFAIFGFVKQADSSLHTQKALYAYFEDAIDVNGIVIRFEDVYTKGGDTVFESMKFEGDRVSAGSHIGTLYGKDAPKDVINTITEINSQIADLQLKKTALVTEYDDVSKVETRMSAVAEDFVEASQEFDGNRITSVRNELNSLMQNKLELSGKSHKQADELDILMGKKAELEAGLVKSDVISQSSGILTYAVDGFEEELTPKIIGMLTPDAVDAWLDYEPDVPESSYSKIVSNNSWYYSFNITVNQLDNLKVYDTAYIKTTKESNDLIRVLIYDISESSEDGRVTVTVESDRDISAAITNRKLNMVFVKNVYEGYKIPIEAVHVKEDAKSGESVVGVYALMGGIVEFRPIKVAYSDAEYIVISNEYDSKTNRIRMYDEIIISTEGIKEGMLFT